MITPKIACLSGVFGISRAFTFVSCVFFALVGGEGGYGFEFSVITQLVFFTRTHLCVWVCVCACVCVVFAWLCGDVLYLSPISLLSLHASCRVLYWLILSSFVRVVLVLVLFLALALHLDVLLCFSGLVWPYILHGFLSTFLLSSQVSFLICPCVVLWFLCLLLYGCFPSVLSCLVLVVLVVVLVLHLVVALLELLCLMCTWIALHLLFACVSSCLLMCRVLSCLVVALSSFVLILLFV